MRYVWLVVILGCSSADSMGADSGRDAGPDPDDAGPDTILCDEGGVCIPRPCEFVEYFDGEPESGLTFEQADLTGASVPLRDGGIAYAVWGFQGGLMLQPYLDIPPDDFDVEPRCAFVDINHGAVEGIWGRTGFNQRVEVVSDDPIVLFDLFNFESADGRDVSEWSLTVAKSGKI